MIGFLHHRVYKATQRATKRIKVHKLALGPLIIVIGLTNGALGFDLALKTYLVVPYVVISCIVGVALAATVIYMVFRGRRKPKHMFSSDQRGGQLGEYASSRGYEGGNQSDIGLINGQWQRH